MNQKELELDYNSCKGMISDFIGENLDGDIDRLKYFDFQELEGNGVYGCPRRDFDCDDTNLARAIYFVVWKGSLPELEYRQIGTGKRYRGDTLNSFNTLLGRRISYCRYIGVEKYSSDKNFIEKVERFYKTYHTIGNFALLPNLTAQITSNGQSKSGTTINLFRGRKWRDYFDWFLFELRKCFVNHVEANSELVKLIQCNSFYFNYFAGSFQKFCSTNYFDEYIDKNGIVLSLFEPYEYHWRLKTSPTDSQVSRYTKYCTDYIDKSELIIASRAKKILEALKLALL